MACRTNRHQPPELPARKVNLTDPDSRSIPVGFGFVQGYNAQAGVSEQQIVLAADITNNSTDFSDGSIGNASRPSSRSSVTPNTYRFHRRGRIKVRTEWRLLMMTHNLGKLHRSQPATAGA